MKISVEQETLVAELGLFTEFERLSCARPAHIHQ